MVMVVPEPGTDDPLLKAPSQTSPPTPPAEFKPQLDGPPSENPYAQIVDNEDESTRLAVARGEPLAPVAQASNPYAKALALEELHANSVMFDAVQHPPDTFAEATRLARRTGIDPDTVLRNLPEVRRRAQFADLQAATALTPELRTLLANPRVAGMAHDDTKPLTGVQKAVNALKRGGARLSQSASTLNVVGTTSDLAALAKVEEQLQAGVKPEAIAGDRYGYRWMSPEQREIIRTRLGASVGTSAANIGVQQGELDTLKIGPEVQAALQSKTYAEFWDNFVKAPVEFITTVGLESLPASLPGLVAAVPASAMGSPAAGVAAAMGINSALVEYSATVVSELRERGVNLQDAEAIRKAVADPEVMAAINTKARRRAAAVATFDAISGGVATKALSRSPLANLLIQVPVQGGLGAAGEIAGGLAEGKRLAEINAGEVAAEFFGEMFSAPIDVAVAGKQARDANRVAKVRLSEERVAGLQKLAEAALESKLRERSPEDFAEFVQQAATQTGEDIENVYVDAQALAGALAQSGIDPASIPGVAEQLSEALDTGATVQIRTGDYTASIVGTELEKTLAKDIKLDPDELTINEANSLSQSAAEAFEKEVNAALETADVNEAFKAHAEAVTTQIFEQMQGAGRFTEVVNRAYAKLVSDFYAATAARLGTTPDKLFADNPLKVVAQQPSGESFSQPIALPPDLASEVKNLAPEQGQALSKLYERAALAKESFDQVLGGIADEVAGEPLLAPLKGAKRAIEKITIDYGGDALRIKDLLRATVVVNDSQAAQQAVAAIQREFATVGEVRNLFAPDTEAADGYRDAKLNVDLGDGLIGEVQVNIPELIAAKEGPGHALYVERATLERELLARGGPISEAESQQLAQLNAQMRKIYDEAFEAATTRAANSAMETGRPSSRTKPGVQGAAAGGSTSQTDTRGTPGAPIATGRPSTTNRAKSISSTSTSILRPPGALYQSSVVALPPTIDVDGVQRPTKNSNGKPIASTEEGIRNFWRWFGDSKIVDDQGRPKIMYHGTNEDFSAFDPARVKERFDYSIGLHFTDRPIEADEYAKQSPVSGVYGSDSKIMPVYLKADSLLETDEFVPDKYRGQPASTTIDLNRAAILSALSKNVGRYDGVIARRQFGDEYDGINAVVFEPTQVKSATGNDGTFDPASANILYQSSVVALPPTIDVDGVQRPTKNSNGKPVASTEEGIRNFWRWFGESKIVDDKGNPLVLYHGTRASFSEIDPEASREGGSFYATPSRKLASDFALYRSSWDGANVVPIFVRAIKTLEIEGDGQPIRSVENMALPDGMKYGEDLRGFANRKGYDTIIFRNVTDDPGSPDISPVSDVYEILEKVQIKSATGNDGTFDPASANILNQDDKQRGAFIPETNTIALLENADLSTFLHETGHFFLVMLDRLADQNPEMASDMQTLLDWFGVKDLDTWRAMSLDAQRNHHEQFARGFEAYLFEGKAPNLEMQTLFQRFSAWLKAVYKSLQALNVQLTDEVRGVMDRLVATDDQIQTAKQYREYDAMFADPTAAGMTATEWADYQRLAARSTADAMQNLQTRSVRDMKWLRNARSRILKGLQKEASDTRKTVRDEAAALVEQRPVYAVQRMLKSGEAVVGDQTISVQGLKLDADDIKTMYPAGEVTPGQLRGMTSAEGIHPDLVAQLFGYTSGDHMVQDILAAPDMQTEIEAETDALMLERHAELSDTASINDATDRALANESRGRMIRAELRALERANGGQARSKLIVAAKDYATAVIARTRISQLKPGKFLGNANKESRLSTQALAKGNTEAAARHKRNQLLHHYAHRASLQAKTDLGVWLRYLAKFSNEGTRKALDTGYLDQIDALLDRFELRKLTQAQIARRVSLADWVAKQEAQGFSPIIPDNLLIEAQRTHYSALTFDDMQGLVDAVKNIEHLGRLKNKLLTAKDQRDFQSVVDDLTGSVLENAKRITPVPVEESKHIFAPLARGLREFAALHRKLSSLVREMDGFKDVGQLWERFLRPINEAGDAEATMRAQASEHLAQLFKPVMKKGGLRHKTFIPEINNSISREGQLAIALNWGNDVNRRRVMEGDRWTETQVEAILSHLTAEDWAFVQGAWDYIGSYWVDIAAKEKRVTGVAPERVTPQAFTTSHGQNLAGGYYPIKYDPRRSERSKSDQIAEITRQALQGAYTRATTRRGHTKARTETVKRPIQKTLSVVFQHVDQVIHDLAWHEVLIDANRLLNNEQLATAIREGYGTEKLDTMKAALRDMATGEAPALDVWESGINYLRTGATIAALGWNMSTAFLQPQGLTQSMVRIGPQWVAKGMTKWLGSALRMENAVAGIRAKSAMMDNRARTMQREINEIQNRVRALSPAKQALEATYFYMIQKMQLIADVPTWLGQYEKHMALGADEATAIRAADQSVLDAQAGGQIKDLAGIQRGNPMRKLFTSFYSFFSTTYNLAVERTKATNKLNPVELGRLMVDYLLLFIIPATLGELMVSALRGDLPDDGDEMLEKLMRSNLSYMTGTVVGLREVSSLVQGFQGYTGPAGLRFFGEIGKLGVQMAQGEVDAALLKTANSTAGILFYYPAGQVQRTVGGVMALIEGDTNNPAAAVFGPPRRH